MKVECITDVAEFAALHDEWNSLLAGSASGSVFLAHEWLYAWWEVFGEGSSLFILAFRADDGLIGIFPGYIKASSGLIKRRTVRLLGSEYVYSDFLDCIARAGREQEVYRSLVAHLEESVSLWDVIELADIDKKSVLWRYLSEVESPYFKKMADEKEETCPTILLPPSWDELLSRVSSKTRTKIGYYRRALERAGKVEIEQICNSDMIAGAFDDLFRIRFKRMDQKGFSKTYIDEKYRQFQVRVGHRLLEAGMLRLAFLKIDGQRVAFSYQFRFKDAAFFYQTGFDPGWGKQSVGFVLLCSVLQDAVEDQCARFEFLRGNEEYKFVWTQEVRRLGTCTMHSASLKGRLVKSRDESMQGIKRAIKTAISGRIVKKITQA